MTLKFRRRSVPRHSDVGAKLSARELSNAIGIFRLSLPVCEMYTCLAIMVCSGVKEFRGGCRMVAAIQSRFHEPKALCVFFEYVYAFVFICLLFTSSLHQINDGK